ncbi:MAG: alpha-L-fucosidase [Bacteroidota bacterium]
MKLVVLYVLFFGLLSKIEAQLVSPLPSKSQLVWHNMEFYLFAHFGPNTFTGAEWGHGDEKEEIFNPSQLDCKQWVRTAKAAGAKGIIITAKHHDGFCLWPSKYSTHTVRESKWKDGKGDVLRELSAACKAGGIKFGVYLSPWDRNHPQYGTPEYNTVFVNMMTEIFRSYGPIYELWWDGANGEGPNGKKQVYDWELFKKTARKLSPTTVVFSDVGPDIRWVGNERGIAGKTNWNTLDIEGYEPGAKAPSTDTLNVGNRFGKCWIPAECDVSIRPGWFYHKEEDDMVKTPEVLFNLYLQSVGRGANLLLNVPPDGRGLFHANDSLALAGFHQLIKENFSSDLVSAATVRKIISKAGKNIVLNNKSTAPAKLGISDVLQMSFPKIIKANCVVINEQINDGQTIAKGKLLLMRYNEILDEIPFTTIGRNRILTFRSKSFNRIKIVVEDANALSAISKVSVFKIADNLVEQ